VQIAASGSVPFVTTTVAFVVADTVGDEMAGPAIRAVELARRVARVARVRLILRNQPSPAPTDLEVAVAGRDERAMRKAVAGVDVLVVFGGVLSEHPWLNELDDLCVVADAYDPAPLEALVQLRHEPRSQQIIKQRAAQMVVNDQLRRADLVLCATERQRHLLIGMLCALGRVNPDTFDGDPELDRLVRIVPFGTPTEPFDARRPGSLREPAGLVPADATVLLWGGGVYEWLDPLLLVDAVAQIADDSVVAVFMGTRHPTPEVPAMPIADQLVARASELGLLGGRVIVSSGWVPFAHRGAHLVDADVGVSLHPRQVEATYSWRTRVLDYLWAGLPVLCSDGDEMASLVRARDLGETPAPGDLAALVQAIERLRDPDRRRDQGARASVVASELGWDSVSRPLIEYCAAPWRAPDRSRPTALVRTTIGRRAVARARRLAASARRAG
jgi:glycosyltransferase involved in cell wall biosynthesis